MLKGVNVGTIIGGVYGDGRDYYRDFSKKPGFPSEFRPLQGFCPIGMSIETYP